MRDIGKLHAMTDTADEGGYDMIRVMIMIMMMRVLIKMFLVVPPHRIMVVRVSVILLVVHLLVSHMMMRWQS